MEDLNNNIQIFKETTGGASKRKLFPLLAILFISVAVLTSLKKPPVSPKSMASILQFAPAPELSAHDYLVKVVGEPQILLGRREWKKASPASLTKVLTSLLTLENISPTDWITISSDDKKVEEKTSPVPAGESLTRDGIIKLAMVGSANDAALTMAEEVGRRAGAQNFSESQDIFRNLMNTQARELGMSDSSFQNPVGFDNNAHYTTLDDLAKLAEYVWFNHPEIWDWSRNSEIAVYSEKGKEYKMKNTNEIIKDYPGILGSKTGLTDKAQEALLMFYPIRPDKTALIILIGSTSRAEDGRKILNWLEELNLKE